MKSAIQKLEELGNKALDRAEKCKKDTGMQFRMGEAKAYAYAIQILKKLAEDVEVLMWKNVSEHEGFICCKTKKECVDWADGYVYSCKDVLKLIGSEKK